MYYLYLKTTTERDLAQKGFAGREKDYQKGLLCLDKNIF